jgi:hypothetical protein
MSYWKEQLKRAALVDFGGASCGSAKRAPSEEVQPAMADRC